MRKVLLLILALCVSAVPAYAEFAALERGQTAGRIIYSVSDSAYLAKSGQAITEEAISSLSADISGLSSADYGKTGLVADGNSRLILRYKADTAGTVAFSVSPAIEGARLESFTTRQELTAPLTLVSTSNGYQASAVLVAPETWPENIAYPRGNFTVTAAFTPTNGDTVTENLTLTLQAPPVVLIHGAFTKNEKMFGYDSSTNSGVWHKLEDAGLTVASWNYDTAKTPKDLVSGDTNGLAQLIADTLNKFNANGIAATRVDLVTHSSGGIIARQYLRTDTDTGNDTPNSYGLGTVRRVVMIASPNLGTPISSYLSGNFESLPESWQNWRARGFWENLGHLLILGLSVTKNYSQEAMTAISLKSPYLAGLGYPGIPFHSIYGKIKADEAKIGQLFDDVVNQNIANLSKIDWLPEQLVDTLTSNKLSRISGLLKEHSDDIRFKELMGALYGDDDYDLVVSETSAKDKFPANAVTSFTGLAKHNHIMLARQDDVAERVLELLRGGTENFMINTASAAEYNAAFDAAMNSFGDYFKASESEDLSKYFDENVTLNVESPKDEYMGDEADGESVIQSVKILGSSPSVFRDDIYVVMEDQYGDAKFFVMNPTNKQSFDVDLWAYADNKGLYAVYYFTVQDGKLKISPAKIVAFAPQFSSSEEVNVFWSAGSNIYARVGEKIPAGLVVAGGSKTYDISATELGVVKYEVADPSIAEIASYGEIKALKEGTTTITATAYGRSASVKFIVKSSASEADTTKDITVSAETDTGVATVGSSGGGCNAGFSVMMIFAGMALVMKKR